MKKRTREDNELKKQSILIVNKRFFEFWEQFGFVLHILALILGVLSITFEVIHLEINGFEAISLIFEVLTIVVVFLIVSIHLLTPVIKQRIVRESLRAFWGKKKVNVTLKWPLEMTFDKEGFPAIKKESETRTLVTDVDVFWDRTRFLERRLKYKMKTTFDDETRELFASSNLVENDFYEETFSPMHIIYNGETKVLTMLVKREIKVDGDLLSREWLFHFDTEKQEVNWSGFMPDSPVYGEWDWNTLNR